MSNNATTKNETRKLSTSELLMQFSQQMAKQNELLTQLVASQTALVEMLTQPKAEATPKKASKAQPKAETATKKATTAQPKAEKKAKAQPKAEPKNAKQAQPKAEEKHVDKNILAHIGKFTLAKTVRTDNGEPIWTMTLVDTIDKQDFVTLSIELRKQFGGYYSRYLKAFAFKEDPSNALRAAIRTAKSAEKVTK